MYARRPVGSARSGWVALHPRPGPCKRDRGPADARTLRASAAGRRRRAMDAAPAAADGAHTPNPAEAVTRSAIAGVAAFLVAVPFTLIFMLVTSESERVERLDRGVADLLHDWVLATPGAGEVAALDRPGHGPLAAARRSTCPGRRPGVARPSASGVVADHRRGARWAGRGVPQGARAARAPGIPRAGLRRDRLLVPVGSCAELHADRTGGARRPLAGRRAGSAES